MRLKIVANLGTNQFPDMPFKNGEVREVKDEALAAKLIARGLARETKEPLNPKEKE